MPDRAAGARRPAAVARPRALRRVRARAPLPHAEVLAYPGATAAIADLLSEQIAPIARWLARTNLLEGVPFSHMVPDPRMLPVESIRFFYLDPNWLGALDAGAPSLAIHSGTDVDIQAALRPWLGPQAGSPGTGVTGVLIRSQMIVDTPKLRVAATSGGTPLTTLRDDLVATGVRLVLFQGVPDRVTLAQPYHGLLFSIGDDGVEPRAVTGGAIGAQLAGASAVTVPYLTAADGAVGGVLDVATHATSLATATGWAPYSASAAVQWNGTALTTTWVSASELTAVVPVSLLGSVGTASVTVLDAGVTSGAVPFAVEPAFSVDGLSPSLVIVGAEAFSPSGRSSRSSAPPPRVAPAVIGGRSPGGHAVAACLTRSGRGGMVSLSGMPRRSAGRFF